MSKLLVKGDGKGDGKRNGYKWEMRGKKKKKCTTLRIRWSSPTQLLIWPSLAYQEESRRDPEFSRGYGRTWKILDVIFDCEAYLDKLVESQ